MFEVTCVDDDGHRLVRLGGEISLATLPRLSDALNRELASATSRPLVIDLDGVEAVDDAGLGILMGFAARARANGRNITVVASLPRLTQRLSETRFDRAVDVVSSITAATRKQG